MTTDDKRALLKRLEWVYDDERNEFCPCCNGMMARYGGEPSPEQKGHAPDCELAAALAEPPEPDARALLLAFVEWQHRWDTNKSTPPTEYEKVCLNAFLASLPSIPAGVATSSQSGEDGQAGPGFYGASPAPVAPHVKVTEVVGQYLDDSKTGYVLDLCDVFPVALCDMIPEPAKRGPKEMGPRGRFHIVCEFWPEDKP